MIEKLHPPSTQTATTNQGAGPVKSPPPASLSSISPFFPTLLPAVSPPTASVGVSPPAAAAAAAAAPTTASAPPVQDTLPPKVEPAAEEEPYTIKCICGFTGDDGNTIYCDICDSWQHIECFYPNNSEEATQEEFAHACHECKPRNLDVAHAVEYQRRRLDAATIETNTSQKPKRPPSKSQSQSHKKKAKPTELLLNGHAAAPIDDASKQSGFAHENNSSDSNNIANNVHNHNSQQHPPPPSSKKAKSSHKSNHSISGSHSKKSPSYSASRAAFQHGFQHGHPLSPATTPPDLPDGIEIHNYSTDFLSMCNDQDAVQNVQTNSFASLAVSNTTSIWLREPDRMLRETGHKITDVFQALPSNIDLIKRSPRVEFKNRILGQDVVVHWRYLATPVAVDKDVPLMELNGQVGFQKDYCSVPANRYEELSCPLPFVFFHPLLPLYIDTRREGSLARYVRRSCRPNAVLDTFLSGGSEYHFWLVSDRQIAPNEQITIPWDFRLPHDAKGRMLRLLGLGDDDATEEIEAQEDEYNNIARWVHLILSEYGGCACDLGNDCAFARFHRIHGGKPQQARHNHNGASNGNNGSGHNKKKGSRKGRSHAFSPTSTTHATDSRAASEGQVDDFPEADKLSTSSRSKPSSRDMTPAPRQGSFDTLGILTEPTDRDKRKVAMVEDSFRRLEQQPRKKKQRTSDGTGTSEKSTTVSVRSRGKSSSVANDSVDPGTANGGQPESLNGSTAYPYVDAATSRSKSGSPVSATSPYIGSGVVDRGFSAMTVGVGSNLAVSRRTSAGPTASYSNAATQTDPTEGEWYSEQPPTPRSKRRVISLSKRLLNCRHRVRFAEECGRERQVPTPAVSSEMDIDSAGGHHQQAKELSTDSREGKPGDVSMADSAAENPSSLDPLRDVKSKPPIDSTTDTASILRISANATSGTAESTYPIKKSPDLRVELPKVPSFNDATAPSAVGTATPLSASSIVQSPFAFNNTNPFGSPVVTPSPVKKKMSLSDYTKSRKAAASRPSVGTMLKPLPPNADEPKSATSADDTAASDSPTAVEKAGEGLSTTTPAATTTVTTTTTTTNTTDGV
ncbi:PHD-finger domain-containing protein [Niveomyces insectorum RCEF 264]|uniref:PHD-finger domain-containing protein n=1 Tax=Niveomyces insectorum RCEF 264 TaxID=1081102 RepID=A0A162JG14_9HYPO|nr:PHD-finger domain-containing protein [Niveomyces insectorum RCEF 264]